MKLIQTTPPGFTPREDDWSNLSERAANINFVPGAQAVHLKRTGHFCITGEPWADRKNSVERLIRLLLHK